MGISAASFLINNLPNKHVDFTNHNGDPCWYTCHKDRCSATRTNPLSSKFQYYNS